MEFDDNQLALASEEIDIMLQEICFKYKIPPLSVCAVLLARMIHFSKISESQQDLAKLMASIAVSIENKELDKPENIH
jgi:hypothetical protein